MSDPLADRMERIERALRDLEGMTRQLPGLLVQALRGSTGGVEATRAPVAREPARKSPQGAGTMILDALVPASPAVTSPPSDKPLQGIGPRLKEHVERHARERAEWERPSPSL